MGEIDSVCKTEWSIEWEFFGLLLNLGWDSISDGVFEAQDPKII